MIGGPERRKSMRAAFRKRPQPVAVQQEFVFVEGGFDHPAFPRIQAYLGSDVWFKGAWMWCLHCERAFPAGSWKQRKGVHHPPVECPYPDCSATVVMDGQSWDWPRELNGYPEIPERGVIYPLYGPGTK